MCDNGDQHPVGFLVGRNAQHQAGTAPGNHSQVDNPYVSTIRIRQAGTQRRPVPRTTLPQQLRGELHSAVEDLGYGPMTAPGTFGRLLGTLDELPHSRFPAWSGNRYYPQCSHHRAPYNPAPPRRELPWPQDRNLPENWTWAGRPDTLGLSCPKTLSEGVHPEVRRLSRNRRVSPASIGSRTCRTQEDLGIVAAQYRK